jgi:RNA polymerase sigma factor (sigma-70 family)
MSEHVETRRKLQDVCENQVLTELFDRTVMSPEQRQMMELHYLKNKDFRYIADTLGYSESTIKRWHRKVLKKLNRII